MTYSERMTAFEQRLLGKTWDEIAELLHYSCSTVERDIKACVNGRRRQCLCVYPAITEVLVRDYNGSIYKFSRACGINDTTLYFLLKGERYSLKTAEKVCKFLGMSPYQAFGKDDRT